MHCQIPDQKLVVTLHGPLCRYVLEFEKCLDRTEPVPWAVVQDKMRAELGRPLEDVFSSVDPMPLASASVAQVHAAGALAMSVIIAVVPPL